jgi:Sec-independent protein translocase protein TatA
MNHDYIKQFDVVNRYLMGKLVAEESEQFEEHFIDCPQCIDQLKTTREFKKGLQLLSVEHASQGHSYLLKEPGSFFLQWRTWAIAASCLLLVAIIISIVLFNRARSLRLEAYEAKSASSELKRSYEEQQQSVLAAEQLHQERERSLAEQVQQLKEELQKPEKERSDTSGGFRDWNKPGINLLVFVLKSVRGGAQDPSEINEINLPRSPTNFVISLSLETEAEYKTYRAKILTDQRLLWESPGLKPDRHNSLTLGFNSSFFRPGTYYLTVEGVPSKAGAGIIATYPFRITKRS